MNAFYEVKTDKNIEEAISALKENIKSVGFGVLWELNFKDKVKEKGFELGNVFYLLDVCNPEIASQILNRNIEMGYVLPCKIVIYEKEHSNYIGVLKPTTLVNLIDGQFSEEAKEIETKLISVLEMSK